jgi:hypothetical protein
MKPPLTPSEELKIKPHKLNHFPESPVGSQPFSPDTNNTQFLFSSLLKQKVRNLRDCARHLEIPPYPYGAEFHDWDNW